MAFPCFAAFSLRIFVLFSILGKISVYVFEFLLEGFVGIFFIPAFLIVFSFT